MNEKYGGKIESVEGLTDVSLVEKRFYNKMGNVANAATYDGDGEIVIENYGYRGSGFFKYDSELSNVRRIDQNWLFKELATRYGKRDGKPLCPLVKDFYEDEFADLDDFDFCNEIDYGLSDEEFYQSIGWYRYALEKYSREVFLPEARKEESEYANSVRKHIDDGLLPNELEQKLGLFDKHVVKYHIKDAYVKQDYAGCSLEGLHGDEIGYHIEESVPCDDENYGDHGRYESNMSISNMRHILWHEYTHKILPSPLGVYNNGDSFSELNSSIRKQYGNDYEILLEADRILTEASTEWLSRIMTGAVTADADVDDSNGVYHVERRVLNYILRDGLEEIEPKTWFLMCEDTTGSDSPDECKGRDAVKEAIKRAFPDCKIDLDIAKLVVERFQWYDYLAKKEKEEE